MFAEAHDKQRQPPDVTITSVVVKQESDDVVFERTVTTVESCLPWEVASDASSDVYLVEEAADVHSTPPAQMLEAVLPPATTPANAESRKRGRPPKQSAASTPSPAKRPVGRPPLKTPPAAPTRTLHDYFGRSTMATLSPREGPQVGQKRDRTDES